MNPWFVRHRLWSRQIKIVDMDLEVSCECPWWRRLWFLLRGQ